MSSLTAHRDIAATPGALSRIILDVAALADWNPALCAVEDTDDAVAIEGKPYPVSTRIPGPATLTYELVSDTRVTWRLAVPGGAEVGDWELRAHANGTYVRHTMEHSGAVFKLLRNAMRPVPVLRLDRLAARAAAAEG